MEFSNLSIHLSSTFTKDEFEEWVVLCWSIWLARNHLIFCHTISEPHAIVARAANTVNSYRDNVLQRGTNKSINPKTPSPGWQSPPLPWYKVNINAAVSSKEARAGIGMLIRNSQGEVMAASNCREISTDNIEFLEALAIQKGIQLAKDIGLVLAITESNSLNVVNLINNKIHNRCEVGWLISNIQEALSSSKSTFQVNHTPRSCNEAAHHLAKLVICNSKERVWLEEAPTEISAYICKDKSM
ncbi:hypothetical protein WN944_015181 [Citrus x changshan-huyou]|uniref:RNase H type-1 domain-containing protein n=1 Tax=Citrus x changshan-huyou TaxID=2935761 RepID=A0AAP0QQU5_9ROSI